MSDVYSGPTISGVPRGKSLATEAPISEYEHSGKFGISLFVVPATGVVAAIGLSILYAYATVYSPLVGYISIVFLGALVGGIGFLISVLARVTKCRNPGFLRLVGLTCGALALYSSWAAFEYALLARFDNGFNGSLIDLFMSPVSIWHAALEINRTGWYSIFGGTPSGTLLWIIWGIEAVLIVAGPAVLATSGLHDAVFCERCNRWCTESLDAARLTQPDNADDLNELHVDIPRLLQALQPAEPAEYPFLRIDLWNCDSCERTAAVQVKQCTVEIEGGDPTEKVRSLTPVWLVEPEAIAGIESVSERL